MQKKLPAFSLYPGDLLKDKNVQACDGEARALWVWMLVHLHDMPNRGEFRLAADMPPMTNDAIANLLAYPIAKFEGLLSQLDSNGVTTRIAGAIANRRMVRERKLHDIRSEAGINGNKVRWQTDRKVIGNGSQNIASSSSSSSSSSLSKKKGEEDTATWLAELKTNPAYAHINFDVQLGKIKAWKSLAKNKQRRITRKFLLGWFNRIDRPEELPEQSAEDKHRAFLNNPFVG